MNLLLFGFCLAAVVPSEIVIPDRAHPGESFAAQELQTWIGRMTGKFIPVETVRSERTAGKEKIYVGSSFAKGRFPADFKAIGKTDGFAVRTAETNGASCVFVFGTQPKGTLHGAYALLERNSDIIWPRPDPRYSAIHSVYDVFSVTNAYFRDVPRTAVRDWQWNAKKKYGAHNELLWGARNRLNRNGGLDSHIAGCFVRFGRGHRLQQYANPAKNFAVHPEWFPERFGKRTLEGGQLCMTAPGLAEEMHVNITNAIALKYPDVPPSKIRIDSLNLTCADNHSVCGCSRCIAPLDCGNGVSIGIEDPAFRSAQYYMLINKIARLLAKSHPNVKIGTYAYAVTWHVPPFDLERNIVVELCHINHDERAPFDDRDRNNAVRERTEKWSEKCRDLWIRTYCGLSGRNYRAIEYAYAQSGRFTDGLKNPVTQFSAEIKQDREAGYGSEVWDASGITHWIINRLWWNPHQDVDSLRKMYVERTYREAAPEMMRFFDLFRDAYKIDRMPSQWRTQCTAFMTRHYLYETGVGEKLMDILDEALAKVRHSVSKEIIERQKMRLAANLARAAALPESKLDVHPLSVGWDRAAETPPFVIAAGPRVEDCDIYGGTPEVKTVVKALYDKEALYLRFTCEAPDAMSLYGASSTGNPDDVPRCVDRLELFLCRPDIGAYWQWLMDPGAADGRDIVYDARHEDAKWRGKWTRRVERTEKAWIVTMRIPFSDLEFDAPPSSLRFNAIRGRKPIAPVAKGKLSNKHRLSSWTGGGVHDSGGLGLLNFVGVEGDK